MVEFTIVSTAAMAPKPLSPHASVFSIGAMYVTPSCRKTARCFAVKMLSHMSVFIAGATWSGGATETQLAESLKSAGWFASRRECSLCHMHCHAEASSSTTHAIAVHKRVEMTFAKTYESEAPAAGA